MHICKLYIDLLYRWYLILVWIPPNVIRWRAGFSAVPEVFLVMFTMSMMSPSVSSCKSFRSPLFQDFTHNHRIAFIIQYVSINGYWRPWYTCICVYKALLLALLDSVSRAHGGGGYGTFVRRPSVRRPCRNYLWTNAWISFKFWLWVPLGHTLTRLIKFYCE